MHAQYMCSVASIPRIMASEENSSLLSNERSPSPTQKEVFPEVEAYSKRSRHASNCKWMGWLLFVGLLLLTLAILGAIFGVGFVVGRNTVDASDASNTRSWGDTVTIKGESVPVISWFDGQMDPKKIKSNLQILTEKPHIAGSEQNKKLAEMIHDQWSGYLFDKVELTNYTVLLSYPATPTVLHLNDGAGQLIYNASTAQEPPLTEGEDDPDVVPPFNAYSGSGTAQGPLVYVNYARIEDFLYLTSNLSLNLSDYVCIARYGAIFRGDKAHLAQRYQCRGLLIYSDPRDYAPAGVPVYPNGPSLPPGGVQRGSLMITEGDPLTPGVPSIEGMYRRPYEEAIAEEAVPTIPVQPISYGDAYYFMSQLSQYPAPESWAGDLEGINSYFIAQSPSNGNETYLYVNNELKEETIYNVIATIYGDVEPDRQVILGNHRDAWVFGAADPNSGTAILMELARTLYLLRQNNWRPGRTLMLASWGAEEYGLIGSTEWVEDKGHLLDANTVAYLNVDIGVEGSEFFYASANPLLYVPLWNASQMVKCPDAGYETVYDQWLANNPAQYKSETKPLISNLGSGSDFTMFLQSYGVSCTTSGYTNSTSYAVYHSVHDNFFWSSNFADPDFTHHVAVGLVWIKVAMMLSTQPILPYDPTYYGFNVESMFKSFNEQNSDLLKAQNISTSYLEKAVTDFNTQCGVLWEQIQKVLDSTDPPSENIVRIITNKFMNMERAFIHPEGLPGRSYFKHVLFAPSSVNSYGSSGFPGISDTIFAATQSGKEEDWNEVRRQIDFVRSHLRYATMIMSDPSLQYAS